MHTWAIAVVIVIFLIGLILLVWWMNSEGNGVCEKPCYDNEKSMCDFCIKRRVYVQPNKIISVAKVDYHQIVTSIAVIPDKTARIVVYKASNGENIEIFNKTIKKGQSGCIFSTDNQEVLSGTVFSIKSSVEAGIDFTAVGYNA